MTYFLQKNGKLYRFNTFKDLEMFTGQKKELLGSSLAAALRKIFGDCELTSFYGAVIRGWIYDTGEPKPDFIKGNLWYGRERYNVDVAELSNGGKL